MKLLGYWVDDLDDLHTSAKHDLLDIPPNSICSYPEFLLLKKCLCGTMI